MPSSDAVVDANRKYFSLKADDKVLDLSPQDQAVAVVGTTTPQSTMTIFDKEEVSLSHYNTNGIYKYVQPTFEDCSPPLTPEILIPIGRIMVALASYQVLRKPRCRE